MSPQRGRSDGPPPPGFSAQRLLPILGWLPDYRREWLWPDVLAGLAVWAVMVPEGMAYAGIVGVPPIMGLYTLVPPLMAYAVLGTSRQLVVGPDTATGLISALTVGVIAARGTPEFDALTSTLAVVIGALFLLFGVLRMGWVAAFIPSRSAASTARRDRCGGPGPVEAHGESGGLAAVLGAASRWWFRSRLATCHPAPRHQRRRWYYSIT
jgi:hypothetical protein